MSSASRGSFSGSRVNNGPADPGFAVLATALSADEVDGLLASLTALPGRSRAGARHLMEREPVTALASDPRLLGAARARLGPEAVPFRATLFDKSPVSNWLVAWHQDTVLPLQDRTDAPGWGPWSVKAGVLHARAPAQALRQVLALRIHLDQSSADNGPLRVVPGTHVLGVLPHGELERVARTGPVVECPVARGGILAMSPLLVHASSKARSQAPRRVLHVEYAARLEIAPGFRLRVA